MYIAGGIGKGGDGRGRRGEGRGGEGSGVEGRGGEERGGSYLLREVDVESSESLLQLAPPHQPRLPSTTQLPAQAHQGPAGPPTKPTAKHA